MNFSADDSFTRTTPQLRDWLLLAVLAVVFAFASIFGSREADDSGIFWRAEHARLVPSGRSEHRNPEFELMVGRDIALAEIGPLTDVVWLRMDIDLQVAELPDQPIALYLSGPFSADVYWDGQPLGNKGRAGSSRVLEVPGPIDATLYIPEGWVGAGPHSLALRVSAFHTGYTPDEIIHKLALGGFRADPRRELRYYAWPLLLSGGLFLIGLFFVRMYLESGALRALLSAAMSGFLLLQLVAEVSRSFVAYDYQWHLFRSLAIWVAAIGWGLSWQLAALSRTRERDHLLAIPVALIAALLVSYFAAGFDDKTTGAIGVMALMPLTVAMHRVAKSKIDAILLLDGALAIALIAMVLLAPGSLLDRVTYILLAIHLCTTWFLMHAGNQRVELRVAATRGEEFFSVKLAGRQLRVPIADVVYLKADGNFCELVCNDGNRHLHQQRLGQIMQSPPPGFVRVQRSYAVNTRYLTSLRSLEGSRYRVLLSTGDELPVSRYRVADLREFMGTH